MTFEGWHVSFDALLQIVGFIAVMIGLYWRMRELVFKLHNDNSQRMTGIETKLDVLYKWWQQYIERRNNH